jgi:breast cancer 2 susceptibility protein
MSLTQQDKYEAESARLQEEMKKNLEKIEDLAATLASYAQDVSDPVSCEPPDSIDSDFDDLLDAASKVLMPRLRSLSSSSIVHLARHAVRRVETAVMEERAELECNLNELCPRREVRDFRMVRISDARPTMKEAKRSGLLNVWEASALGDGLVEGRRYMVSAAVRHKNELLLTPVHRLQTSCQAAEGTGRHRIPERQRRYTSTPGGTRDGRQ